jgi:hypothetical protein
VKPFELDWMGGKAAAHVRRRRPGIDDLPWGTLHAADYPEPLVDRARLSWTDGAFSEYRTAAAFTELVRALLAAGAPIDLVGMAADFVADEMLHVELNARMAAELGGGAPYLVDLEALAPATDPSLSALERASELAVRISCVGEAFSAPLLVATTRAARHPLTRAVLARIARDEPPHARLGGLYLAWVADRLDEAERRRLAAVALDELAACAPAWRDLSGDDAVRPSDIGALGWMEAGAYARAARAAVRTQVVAPLLAAGLPLDVAAIEALLAAGPG